MKYASGAVRIRLSVRSNAPPIPGIRAPVSFVSARRFKTDSIRSDTMVRTAIGRAIAAATNGVRPIEKYSEAKYAMAAPTPMEINTPPTAPSQVFLGLIVGDILCLPIARPVRSAPTSQNFDVATTQRHNARFSPS